MALTLGSRLGVFEVTAQIGERRPAFARTPAPARFGEVTPEPREDAMTIGETIGHGVRRLWMG